MDSVTTQAEPGHGQKEKAKIIDNKLRIIKYIEQGLWFKAACIAAGVTEQTGHRYKREDISFISQCEAANAKYIEKLVQCVNAEALKDGKVALQVLKIRSPEVWDPKRKIQIYNPQEEFKRIHDLIYGSTCPREVH